MSDIGIKAGIRGTTAIQLFWIRLILTSAPAQLLILATPRSILGRSIILRLLITGRPMRHQGRIALNSILMTFIRGAAAGTAKRHFIPAGTRRFLTAHTLYF